MPIRAIFTEGIKELTVSGLHQWDYGQKLEIHGLALPAMIEVHFACLNMTEAHVRIGTTADGVTTVAIPDGCLEHDTPLRAWVYVVDTASGRTERTIHLPIQARTKPQGADSRPPFVADEYKEAIEQINNTVDSWRDGIVDQNDGGKTKVWTGTRAEFNALEQTDDHTLYVITDELPDYTTAVAYLEAIQNGDEAVPKATQAHYSMDGHNLNEMGVLCDYVQQVQDAETPVPQASSAHYDRSGRSLNGMGYFGDKFQPVTRLTEHGVYQIVADDGLQQFYFPLVVHGGIADNSGARSEQLFAGPYGTVLKVSGSGYLTVWQEPDYPYTDTELGAGHTIYARKISSGSGW